MAWRGVAEVKRSGEERDGGGGSVSCSVCLQLYRQARLLPCAHTFCLPCLQQLAAPRKVFADEREEQQPSKPADTGSTEEFSPFKCPTCRETVIVPPGGVEEFKVNFAMEAEVARQTVTPVMCDTCEGHARVACSDCQKRLCSKCRQIHDHFVNASFHSFIPLNPDVMVDPDPRKSSSSEAGQSKRKTCKTHDQDIVLFCKQCDAVLCHQCQERSHRGHVTEDLSTVTEQSRKEMQGLLKKVQDEVKIVDEVIKNTNQELQELKRQEEEVVGQSVEAAGKVTAWANQAENSVVAHINAISAPIRTKLLQQKNSSLERKTTLNQLKDRARCIMQSGSFLQLKTVTEQMEASLSASQPPTGACQSEAVGVTKNNSLFQRHSSGQELLQITVPRFVGEVTAGEDDEQKDSSQKCQTAWDFPQTLNCIDGPTLIYTTAKGFTAINSCAQVVEFTPGNKISYDLRALFRANYSFQHLHLLRFHATTLPSSVTLLCCVNHRPQVSLLQVEPDQHSLVPATLAGPSPPSSSALLSHDSMPNGRHAYTCEKKRGSINVYEIQELAVSPRPANITARPVFQIVFRNNVQSFDVSSDANYFAVLNFMTYHEHESRSVVAEVGVFRRMNAEPCAVFRSPKTTQKPNIRVTGDVCFSPHNGKEMLRVAVCHDDTVYTLDFRNGCTVVGPTFVEQPHCVRVDGAGRVWVVCQKQLVGFTTSQ